MNSTKFYTEDDLQKLGRKKLQQIARSFALFFYPQATDTWVITTPQMKKLKPGEALNTNQGWIHLIGFLQKRLGDDRRQFQSDLSSIGLTCEFDQHRPRYSISKDKRELGIVFYDLNHRCWTALDPRTGKALNVSRPGPIGAAIQLAEILE